MDFTPGQKRLLLYWGNIQQSVSTRTSTAELWASVKAAAAAAGDDLTGVRLTDMNLLRSIAAQQRNAREFLNASRVNDVVTARMIATDLSARTLQQQQLAPRWIVRFEHDVVIDGQLQTFWRSSVFDGVLPSTKGGLMNAVGQDAVALADDYGVTHIGIGQIQVSAV